jgi:hypothetical protein
MVLTLVVELKPNARRASVASDGDTLRLSVRSPPIDGRANAEATAELARLFGVPKSRVTLVQGSRGRRKRFSITEPGVVPAQLERYCTVQRN